MTPSSLFYRPPAASWSVSGTLDDPQHSVLQILQLLHDGARQVIVHLLVEVLVDGVHLVLPELGGCAHQGLHVNGVLVQTLHGGVGYVYILFLL